MEKEEFTIRTSQLEEVIYNLKQEFETFSRYSNNRRETIILIGERYLMRIDSSLAAFITIDLLDGNEALVNIIIAGGSKGLFRSTWGAEGSMLRKVKNHFQEYII
jgi:hypothetical protein